MRSERRHCTWTAVARLLHRALASLERAEPGDGVVAALVALRDDVVWVAGGVEACGAGDVGDEVLEAGEDGGCLLVEGVEVVDGLLGGGVVGAVVDGACGGEG